MPSIDSTRPPLSTQPASARAICAEDELPAYSFAPPKHHLFTRQPAGQNTCALPPPSALAPPAPDCIRPPALDAATLEGPLWGDSEGAALAAFNQLVTLGSGSGDNEALLCGLSYYAPLACIRCAATDRLGEIASVHAVDGLLELFWWGEPAVQETAKFRLSPGTVQLLDQEAHDAPELVNRCLRDLVFYAPSDTAVPEDALWMLRTRSAYHPSARDALLEIAERCPKNLADIALRALEP